MQETITTVAEKTFERYDELHPHGRVQSTILTTQPPRLASAPLIDVSAVALINCSGQVLAGFNTKRQVWDVPQGVVEAGETPIDAALRELEEEVGLFLLPSDLYCTAEFIHMTEEFIVPFRNRIFVVRAGVDITGVKNCEPHKCSKLAWFAPCQLPTPRGLSLRVLLTLLGRG